MDPPEDTHRITTRSGNRYSFRNRPRTLDDSSLPQPSNRPRRLNNYASQYRNPEAERRSTMLFYRNRARRSNSSTGIGIRIEPLSGSSSTSARHIHSGPSQVVSQAGLNPLDSGSSPSPLGSSSSSSPSLPPSSSSSSTTSSRPFMSRAANPQTMNHLFDRLQSFRQDVFSLEPAAFLQNLFSFNEGSSGLTKKQIDESTVTYRFKPIKKNRTARRKKNDTKNDTKNDAKIEEAMEDCTKSDAMDCVDAVATGDVDVAMQTSPAEAVETSNNAIGASEMNSSEFCVICFDKFVSNSKLRRLPCLHVFHYKCIDSWLKNNIKCPICRMSIPVDYNKLLSSLESGRTLDQCMRDHEANVRGTVPTNLAIRLEFLQFEAEEINSLYARPASPLVASNTTDNRNNTSRN